MGFLDALFGRQNNSNQEEEEKKKKQQQSTGNQTADDFLKWVNGIGDAFRSGLTPSASTPAKPAAPTISEQTYNNVWNAFIGNNTNQNTPSLPDLTTTIQSGKITTAGNSPLLPLNENNITGNRRGWGYGSGTAVDAVTAKEWDELLDPNSTRSRSMDPKKRATEINNKIPAWYVNAYRSGTQGYARTGLGADQILPEDGNIMTNATKGRENIQNMARAQYNLRETGRYDYMTDPWGNLADPSLYSTDYLADQVDEWKDKVAAEKLRTENALHSIEDINDAFAWSYRDRDFRNDKSPVDDFELEGYAKYIEGSDFDPNTMTKEERDAMVNRYIEWGLDDGVLKFQDQLRNNRTKNDATLTENAGVTDANEEWLNKLQKEQAYRNDFSRMKAEADRDPNFAAKATYTGPLPGKDFASRLYNALHDPQARSDFEMTYDINGAASPITSEGYDLMTPEELQYFSWYAENNRGQEFLDMMKPTLQHRNAAVQEAVTKAFATENFGTAALSWSIGRFANLGTAFLYPFQAANAALGGETDAASSLYAPNRFTNDVTEAQTQAIANSNFLQIPGFEPGTNLGTWLYQAATSAADSLLGVSVGTMLGGGSASKLGKALANVVMSSEAASHALEDNLLRGLDPTHALLTSVADGMAEAISETWSIESLLSDPTHFLPYLAKNVFSEASEEGASAILQAIGDKIVNGDNTQYQNDVNALILMGVKPEEANKQVMRAWLNDTLQSAIIGGLSGGMSAGTMGAVNAIGEAAAGNRINQQLMNNTISRMTREAANTTQNVQTEQNVPASTEEAERRAPETPNKPAVERTQDEAQKTVNVPTDNINENDDAKRRAPETPDKAPLTRTQDEFQTPDNAPQAENERRAPETPDKAPLTRTQDEFQTPDNAPQAENERRAPETPDKAPLERTQDEAPKAVNTPTDNVNENDDAQRRAPEQPVQQSARAREAEQEQAVRNLKEQESQQPKENKRRAPDKPTKENRKEAERVLAETQKKVAEIGATLEEGSEARKTADAVLKKLEKGKRIRGRQSYQLYSQIYNQLGEQNGRVIKKAAEDKISFDLQKAGVTQEDAERMGKNLAAVLTDGTKQISRADLDALLTTRQTRAWLADFVGTDTKDINEHLLKIAANLPSAQMQLRLDAYQNAPEAEQSLDNWSMMRRILEGTYVESSGASASASGKQAQTAQDYMPAGTKDQVTYADADGNEVKGAIVKITTKAAALKAKSDALEKMNAARAEAEQAVQLKEDAQDKAMEGLSQSAKDAWKQLMQNAEKGPKETVSIPGNPNGPTMEEFKNNLRNQLSSRVGEAVTDSVNDIILTIRDADGKTHDVSIDDVTGTSSSGVQTMLEYALETPEIMAGNKLNLMFQWYEGEQPQQYMSSFNNVYNAGFSGYIMDPAAVNALGETRAQAIYDAGTQAAAEAERIRKANIRTTLQRGSGHVTVRGIADTDTAGMQAFVDSLDANQKASYDAIVTLSKATGMNFQFFRSEADANGRYTEENGHYNPITNSIALDINAGRVMTAEEYTKQGKPLPQYAILRTAGHEITHYIENNSAEGYAKLRDFVTNELMRRGADTFEYLVAAKQQDYLKAGSPLTREGAIAEVVADSMEMILQDSQAIKRMAAQERTVFERIRDFIHDFVDNIHKAFTGVEAESREARLLLTDGEGNILRYADRLVKLWDDALLEATAETPLDKALGNMTEAAVSENVNAAAATDAEVKPAKGNVMQSAVADATQAQGTDGTDLFSYRSMSEDKDTLLKMLTGKGIMSAKDINALSKTIDAIMNRVEQNPEILDFGQNIGRENRSFVPVKPNSDPLYKVSLDLSTLCRKRILQQAIQERLENQYNTVLTPQQRVAVRDALFQLAKQGKKIEVACALCYVESARLKSPAQIDRWLKNKNEFMRVYFSKKSTAYSKQIQDRVDQMARDLGYEPGTGFKEMKGKDSKAIHKMKADMYRQYQPTSEEQKIIETAKALPETMYKTAQGLWQLKQEQPEIFESFTTHVRNATKSKGIEGDTPFYAGDTDSVSDALIKSMNAENGMRMQSWSDYQVYHTLDYISAMIELGSRGAKVQTYTKVPAFLKLMGHTGAMINMSMIPADYNGKTLEYDNVEGMDYDTMMELRDAYHATAGNIVIGISDAHIRALLAANDVDYVIPYHKSSLNAKMREAIGLKAWTDFEKYQNETNRDYDNTVKDKNYRKHLNFSEWFDLAEARRYAQEYSKLPKAQRTQGEDIAAAGRYAMQKMADRYIELCHQRGLQEKFAQFANEDGYWKLLIDRKMVDNVTGEIIEQQPVKPIFSQNDILDVLNDEVKRFQAANNDQQEATEAIVKMWEEGKIQEAAKSTKIMNYFQNYYAHVAAASSQGPADVANTTTRTAAVQYSARTQDDEESKSIKEQLAYHRDEIEKHGVVANINIDMKDYGNGDKVKLRQKVTEEWKKIGYHVDRQNFGYIEIDPEDIKVSMTYLNTLGEKAALLAVPKVLKRGIELPGHQNHKDRRYRTYTFAGRVIINGTPGDMAVVVRATNKYGYKTHRIVMPDGSVFKYNNAEPTTGGRAANNGPLEPRISSASINDFTRNNDKINSADGNSGNIQRSIRMSESEKADLDSFYNEAIQKDDMRSAEIAVKQMALQWGAYQKPDGDMYFYHGTNANFNRFDPDKIGSSGAGSYMGYGFNFAADESMASGYGTNLKKVFLKIENPLLPTKKTITAVKLAKVIQQMENYQPAVFDGDEWTNSLVWNYDSNMPSFRAGAYEKRNAYMQATRNVARMIVNNAESDADIYSELSASGGADSADVIRAFQNLGYDAVLHNNSDGDKLRAAIVFSPSQIKSAETVTRDDDGNVIPLSRRFDTSSEDIRYSIRIQPLTDTREFLMGLDPQDLSTDAERAVLASYKAKVNEFGAAQALVEKYENDLLNEPKGATHDQTQKHYNQVEVARQKRDRIQAELDRIENSPGYAAVLAKTRKAMSVIQTATSGGNIDQYFEAMRNRLVTAEGRIDDILRDLQDWPKPSEGTTARLVFGKSQLNQQVSELMKRNPSTLSRDEITDSLAHIALLFNIGDADSIQNATTEIGDLARKMQLQKNESIESYELTQLADAIGAFSLNDNQKKEVKRVFGSINNFKKALQGYGRYDPKAGSLDANWAEIVGMTGNQLELNIGDAQEPIALVDLISSTIQSAQAAQALSPEDQQAEFEEIQGEILMAATNMKSAIPLTKEAVAAIQDFTRQFSTRVDKLDAQLMQLVSDADHARANADLAQASYTANTGNVIKGVDAIRTYYSKVADQYTREIMLQKERELKSKYEEQLRLARSKAALKLEQSVTAYQNMLQKNRELRDLAQKIRTTRNIVRRQVMRINKALTMETNTKHVPEELKGLAEAVVQSFARADQNGRGIILSQQECGRILAEYSYLMQRDGDLDSYEYDPDTLAMLAQLQEQLTQYRAATISGDYSDLENQRKRLQVCQNIAQVMENIGGMISMANTVFIGGQMHSVAQASEMIGIPMSRLPDFRVATGAAGKAATNLDDFTRWGNMTPYYFKRQVNNAGLTALMDDLETSEHHWGLGMQQAHDRLAEIQNNYHYYDWDDSTVSISDGRGGTIELTREQAMSILAIWQREHYDENFRTYHLEEGGFVLADDGKKRGKGILGLDANPLQRTLGTLITQDEINTIQNFLTDEQKAYMKEIISYLSNDMSEIGNDTSMRLYGIKKYKEKVYFPIQSYRGGMKMKSDAGSVNPVNDKRIEHVGFSNSRLRGANNTIVISDFSTTAAGHIQQMLMYANFAPTIEALNKTMNAQWMLNNGQEVRIRQLFEMKYGKNAVGYLQDYIKALNGGVNPDTQDSLVGKMISLFKKTAVVGSLSVAAKQPMSIIRAATMINPRYLTAAAGSNLIRMHGQASFEEAEKYAGTAVIKDIGKFDTGVGMSNVDWLLERDSTEYDLWTKAKEALNVKDWETWKARWNDILGFLPSRGDSVTWGTMWEAVKMEQHALHPGMNQNTEEFLSMCGQRFNDVMRATQVYDSTIAKSPNVRSQSQFMKMLSAFMNEPVLTANMLYDAVKNAKNKDMKNHINPAAAGACFLLSAAAQAFITSLFSAIRSDDKDKTILEKMAGTFGKNLRGEINPFSLIPGVSDLVEVLEGGDVERTDLSAVSDAVNKLQKLASGKYAVKDLRSAYVLVEDVGGSIAKLFGVPVKNVMREVRTIWNVFTQPARGTDPTVFRMSLAEGLHVLPDKFLGFTLVDSSTQAYVKRMYNALRSGNEKAAADYREYLIDGKGVKEGSMNSKLKSLLYNDYINERITMDDAIAFGVQNGLWKKEKDAYAAIIKAADKSAHADEDEYSTTAYVNIFNALLAGDKAAYTRAVNDMTKHGYTEKGIASTAKSQIADWYKAGELDQTTARNMLAMIGITGKNDVYWTLDSWDYQAEHGDTTGYSKYDAFIQAVASGSGLQAAIQEQVSHSDKSQKEIYSTLAGQITTAFKQQYTDLVKAGRTGEAANLQARLLTAYEALGYNRGMKLKDIQKWAK